MTRSISAGTTRILGLFIIKSTSAFEADLMDDINVGASTSSNGGIVPSIELCILQAYIEHESTEVQSTHLRFTILSLT
ncbi:hypothetical protein H5410_049832 [Solanum commersonii]|uniref:Uncharacterized protein n=1 Tax=Solanum commersonii TaxID=4109 RepID=A0A9J5WVA8_SOLCO|nr:hypothetical protein H5410_049832 [Solanum commersonii]